METEGLIIRSTKYGEGSKMLTILTPEGKVEAAANGANSLKSRLFAGSQLFCYSKIVLKQGKGKHPYTSSCDVTENFYGIRNDVAKVAMGVYFCELLDTIVTGEDSARVLKFALNTLYMLEKLDNYTYLKPLFELRLLSLIGFMPNMDSCVVCGDEGSFDRFSIALGGVVCEACGNGRQISKSAVEAMRYICTAPDKAVFSFAVSEQVEQELWDICEEYLLYHIGRAPYKLEYLKKMLDK